MATSKPAIECFPSSSGPDRAWPGAKMSTGGKGYASAPLGQLHYRDIGPRDSTVTFLLFHQSPQNLLQFGEIQNVLAARGVRSIAVDTPGYGMSDQPDCVPTIGGLADNMLALLDEKGLKTVVVGGHHTGACIATALAARHPGRVTGIILHGCAVLSPQEAEDFMRAPEWPRKPVRDGSHLTHIFSKWPSAGDDADLAFKTWISASMFFQGPDIGHFAVYRYDMATDLRRIEAPGLIIAETEDMTHHMDERARALRPDFMHRVIADSGISAVMYQPQKWADLAMEFLRSRGLIEV